MTSVLRLRWVVAACDSALERLGGSKNPALVARAASLRVARVLALRRLAEVREVRAAAGRHHFHPVGCKDGFAPRSSRVPLRALSQTTRSEFMAIPIVVGIIGVVALVLFAATEGPGLGSCSASVC